MALLVNCTSGVSVYLANTHDTQPHIDDRLPQCSTSFTAMHTAVNGLKAGLAEVQRLIGKYERHDSSLCIRVEVRFVDLHVLVQKLVDKEDAQSRIHNFMRQTTGIIAWWVAEIWKVSLHPLSASGIQSLIVDPVTATIARIQGTLELAQNMLGCHARDPIECLGVSAVLDLFLDLLIA